MIIKKKMNFKSAFIESSLRPFVKGSEYDNLEINIDNSRKPETIILENFNLNNKFHRKKYIIQLLQLQDSLPSSTQQLITILKQFFPKI
jgi:hypothetical protein